MVLIHPVSPGETLTAIAARYGVTLAALLQANQPPDPDDLVVGQTLVIPTPGLTYVVRSGDTLFAISQDFGVTVSALVAANGIADPDLIFVGQALAIPGWEAPIHTVAPGETLSGIARTYDSSVALILRVNLIPNPDLIFPGQRVVVPSPGPVQRPLVTNGFIYPIGLTVAQRLLAPIGRLLTYLSIFAFPVSDAGEIAVPDYGPVAQAGREQGLATLAVLTNFAAGNFSPELARTVLGDRLVRDRLIERCLTIIRQGAFAGVMVDFENMYPEDRPLYTEFIAALAASLRPLGLVTAIAVAPKWADFPNAPWVGAFDYEALGRLVEFMFIMTYEWGWAGGPPQPVAPINLVRRVLAYATSLVPPSRVMQGIPLYGYDWPLPDTPESVASSVDPQRALALAATYGARIAYDELAQAPTFTYNEADRRAHEVWFEDARSVRAKYRAARDFNLMGAGFWQLQDSFPQNWVELDELFTVTRVARGQRVSLPGPPF